ncbi:MAG: methyl-accepting chemotaxis protein [Firmicutes bacterium]|nr:methyl-accepting chemotaxis protein [Bacillota bacterium]
MSLYKKLALFFMAVVMVVLGSTLTVVYTQSQAMIESQAEQKTVLLIQTINAALEAGIPDFYFEDILLHMSEQNRAILSFNIYKLNGYYYDIASTNANYIGKRAPVSQQAVMERGVPTTTMHGDVLHIVAPVLINGVTLYSADVQYSMAQDLSSTGVLLERFMIVGLVAILLAALILWAFSRQLLSRPLHAITAAANDIAAGNLQPDLATLSRRADEIGMLARSFVRMADQLSGMIAGIARTSEELRSAFQTLVASGDNIARGAMHVTDVMDHMGREVRSQVTGTDDLAQLSQRLREIVESLTEIAGEQPDLDREDVRDGIERISRQTEDISEAVSHIQEVSRTLQDGLKTIVSTASGQLGRVQEVNRSIARLQELAAELQKLTAAFDMA